MRGTGWAALVVAVLLALPLVLSGYAVTIFILIFFYAFLAQAWNVVGGYDLPWSVVRAVRFDRNSPWATLELANDEQVSVHALQAADKDYAVDGVRALRALHSAAVKA